MASFHERLAELREAEGLKKKDFAKILHVSAGTISNYESGRHTPDMNTLIAIAEYFQVSVDYLLGLTSRKLPLYCMEEEYVTGTQLALLVERLMALSPEYRVSIDTVVGALYRDQYQNTRGE